ncbi:hypothetical protein GJ496_011176 [Pomphorhynchus laevis]|nr:hypothetical protein GJ496_011176 [Pomphorhynchus laevis]
MTLNKTNVDDIVCINVGGRMFNTRRSTLNQHPYTLLGSSDIENYWNDNLNAYFFDRNDKYFNNILDFYRTGELSVKNTGMLDQLFKDIEFFRLGSQAAMSLVSDKSNIDNAIILQSTSKYYRMWTCLNGRKKTWKSKMCSITRIILIIAFVIVGLSITNMIVPPVNLRDVMYSIIVDIVLTTILFIDVFLQLVMTPSILSRTWLNSLTSIIFFPVVIIMTILYPILINKIVSDNETANGLVIYFTVQILIVTKIITVTVYSLQNEIIIRVLTRSLTMDFIKIAIIIIAIFVVGTLFGTIAFFTQRANSNLNGIGDGLYWAIITMTTVGYGDITFNSTSGRILSMICSCSGPIITAMLIPVVSNSYYQTYSDNIEHIRYDDETKMILKHIAVLSDIHVNKEIE